MSAFRYTALESSGREKKGQLEADSSRQVRQQLRDQGLTPLRIEVVVRRHEGSGKLFSHRTSMSSSELALVTRQLATLVQSSMPLEESLASVARQAEKPRIQELMAAVRSRVVEGYSLAAALAEFPVAFPSLYCSTVAAGEKSGNLGLILERLADYTEGVYSSKQKVRMALLYPSMLFVMSFAIVGGLMAFVVPDVVEVFVGQGQELPAMTQGLIALSDFIVDFGVLMVLLIFAAIVAGRYAMRNPVVRHGVHRVLLKTPIVGRLIRGANSARFSSTLSILTRSGLPLVDALSAAGDVLSNAVLRESVQHAAQEVLEGGALYRALEHSGHFPPMMIHMIASGEASGNLDNMLERVAVSQQREFDNMVSTLLGILEPVTLLIMGVAVLTIVIAILQPIFNINQLI